MSKSTSNRARSLPVCFFTSSITKCGKTMPPSSFLGLFPVGFLPLPHPKNDEGGMVFPHFVINEVKKQTGRDLARFDVDFDKPDHSLPEFPAAIYLTTRPDLGDVSQGQVVTTSNYYTIFNGILTPKQLDGFRF